MFYMLQQCAGRLNDKTGTIVKIHNSTRIIHIIIIIFRTVVDLQKKKKKSQNIFLYLII